jgi:hypothetical protein
MARTYRCTTCGGTLVVKREAVTETEIDPETGQFTMHAFLADYANYDIYCSNPDCPDDLETIDDLDLLIEGDAGQVIIMKEDQA